MFTTREKRAIGRAWSKMNWLDPVSKETIHRHLHNEQLRGGNDLTVLTDKFYNLIQRVETKYRWLVFNSIRDEIDLNSVVYFTKYQILKEVKQELKNLKIKIKDCYFETCYDQVISGIGFKNNDDLITFRLGQSILTIDKIIDVSNI